MAEHVGAPARTSGAPQGRTARAWQWLQRAKQAGGHERNTLELVLKSALAASISWAISYGLMSATTPAFAPFSSVLIMQVTVYQSLWQAVRYVGAVSLGVALQGVLGLVVEPDWLTFVLIAVAAIAIGRWRPLGSQGSQVATAAFFAFSTYVSAAGPSEKLSQLGEIIVLVVIGCGVGCAVNLLVFPPMRYRSVEHGIQSLAHSMCDLISDMHPALQAEQQLEAEHTKQWRQRAARLNPQVSQAQASIQTALESTYYNPRRILLRRHARHPSFAGYQAVVDALERVTHQLVSMTRSFDRWHDGGVQGPGRQFLSRYGDFLACLTPVTRVLAGLDEDRLPDQTRELRSAVEEAQQAHVELSQEAAQSSLPLGDPSSPYGVLLVEAARLMDEFQHTQDVLQQSVSGSPA